MTDPVASASLDKTDFVAIVDTNVLLDIFSCHDLSTLYDRLGHADVAAYDPQATYRRARVRDSLLLAMYLHNRGATTFSPYEARTIMVARVPPSAVDTFENHYTTIIVNFVKDQLLSRWRALSQNEDDNLHGTRVDESLIALAGERQVPLITNEGFTQAGVVETGIRERAARAGVVAVAPREFFQGQLDEEGAARAFIAAFRGRANGYIDSHPKRDVVLDSMKWAAGYLRHVLFGETNNTEQAVPVHLQDR